jgi:glucose-1-phosphate thymidylyltransferase
MFKASVFIQTLRERQGLNVACPEEVAYKMNYITAAQVSKIAQPMKNSDYGRYLLNLIDGKK